MAISKYSDLQGFKIKLTDWLFSLRENQQDFYSVFFSYGDKSIRCRVWNTADKNYDKVVKRTLNFIDKLYEKNNRLPEFLKFDFAKNIEERKWTDLVKEVSEQKHNNYYRKGIAFDENLSIFFLEQEVYAKAIIRGVVYNEPNFFDEKNLNDAIRKKIYQC